MKKSVAIIPARGGSKRLPGKNLKPFHGKPIIKYSIDAALRSELFSRVIVSTDSAEIADLAIKSGAEAPFLRPPTLADDFTPLPDVLTHSLEWLENNNEKFDYSCMILATAPFIQVTHLKQGFERIKKNDATAVIPVASFQYPILRALKMDHDDKIAMAWPEHETSRSNDLPEFFHDVGQFYWVNNQQFKMTPRLFTPQTAGIRIPSHFVQDIDTVEDWQRAELMFAALEK